LITTPEILRRIATHPFSFGDSTTLRKSFIELYEIDEGSPGPTLDAAIEKLSDDILRVAVNPETGVVRVTVRSKWPRLSEQVAQEVLDEVNRFNLQTRQAQALAQQQFFRARADTAYAELQFSEDRLKAFLKANREFRSDPELAFTHDRLTRDLLTRQGIYTTLAEGYEQSRIEAVRNTPSVAVVEVPRVPLRADKRRFALRSAVAAFVGAVIAAFLALVSQIVDSSRSRHPEDALRFRRIRADASAKLRRVLRLPPAG
jgi:uncharacterized protein involved in exopolysaccharide biosynthesis